MKRRITALFLAGLLCAGTISETAFAAPQPSDPTTEAGTFATDENTTGILPSENTDDAVTDSGSTDSDSSSDSTSEDSISDAASDDSASETDPSEEAEKELEAGDGVKKEKKEIILPPPGTVTGFEFMDPEVSSIYLTSKCTMEELTDRMPETILVHLDNSAQSVEIPVTWVSEIDFETTDEYYYIFWADWDKEMFPLTAGYGYESYLPFVEVIVDSPVAYAAGESAGINNIVARARQMVDIRWTPVSNLNGFSDPEDPLTVYYAGNTYNGIPYGQQVSGGTWVPNTKSFDTFLQAVANPGSPMYTSRGGYGSMNSTYYANDCSAFASYCYGLPRMTTWSFGYSSQFVPVAGNSIYNAEVGDCFNCAGSHIEMITGMNYEGGNLVSVEVSEQTPPKARTIIYTPTRAQQLINSGYTLLRFVGRASVGAPEGYSGYASDRENPVKVDYATEDNATLTIDDVNDDGSVFKITFAGAQSYRRTDYNAAIWSDEGGQDDLHWVTLSRQNDGSYTATIKASDYKHKGNFTLHLYKRNTLFGENFCIRKEAFFCPPDIDPATTEAVSVENISIEDFDELNGTCKIVLSGVTCPDGVKKMLVPVWSESKQGDIIWYEAAKVDDTTWTVGLNIAKHKYNYGTYQIHVYGTNKYGKQIFCGNSTVTFTRQEASVSAEVTGTKVVVTVKNISIPGGAKSVVVPTWSAEKGQDDLIWENASYDRTTGSATVTIDAENYKHFGNFYSHVYASDSSGKLVFVGSTTYAVAEPEYDYNEINASYDRTTGDFTVAIHHPKAEEGSISSVVIPVWSGSKQADIIWYEASKVNNNKWSVSSNIRKHLGIGTYHCHVYGRVNGAMVFLGNTSFTADLQHAGFSVGASENGVQYPVAVTGLNTPVAFSRVSAAVWSAKNGQDDIAWYTLSDSNGVAVKPGAVRDLAASIDITKHATSGLYYAHLYGYTTDGRPVFIDSTTFNVTTTAKAELQIIDTVENDGKVTLIVDVKDQDWAITKISVPTWCSSDQSDICWYTATPQSDGTWKVEVDKKYHKNHTGKYIFHTYAYFSNGIVEYIGNANANVA